MEYYDNLKDVLMRSNHKFIYGEKEEREKYLEALAREYSFQSEERKPVGIYIKDTGLEACQNESCDIITISDFNHYYFEMLVAFEIINKMLKELPVKNLERVEPSILRFFNMDVQGDKLKSLDELTQELLKTKEIYALEYARYIASGEKIDFYKLRLMSVMLDFMAIKLKNAIPTLERINLFIDKDSEYSEIYTRIINFYINARSNQDLSINIGCKDWNDWPIYRDINGNFVQASHDFKDVKMSDFALERKKKEME